MDLTTLITIAVAVFVLLRLRSVLGQRTGHQKPPPEFGQDRIKRTAANQDSPAADNVVKLPNQRTQDDQPPENPAIAEINEIAKPRTKLNKGLKDILSGNETFSPVQFLAGSELAYEMIVNAFAEGNRKALRNLLSKEVYGGFDSVISEREKTGETVKSSFIGIDSSSIQAAEQKDNESQITVRFVSQIISATFDRDGKLTSGDDSQIARVTDIWTFARNTGSRDPNWKLVATESEG